MPDESLKPASWDDVIAAVARANGVNPILARSVASTESALDPTAVSKKGAIGIMQLMPDTAKELGVDPNDPLQNIQGGVKYLKSMSDRYQGDLNKALAAYNAGPGMVDSGAALPAETQAYVANVLAGLSKRTREGAKATPQTAPAATPPAASAPAAPAPDQGGDLLLENITNLGRTAAQAGAGAIRGAVSTVQTLAKPIRKAFGMEPATPPPAETTTAGKIGRGAEQVGEFLVPAGAVSKGVKALELAPKVAGAVEAAAQAGTAYGVTKAQGGTGQEAGINAALGAVGPVVDTVLKARVPQILQAAQKKLAQRLAVGLENKGPMVGYAIKSGQIGNPGVAKDVEIVGQAAADLLDTPISASWGKWQTQLAQRTGEKVKSLKEALAGPLGSQEINPKELIGAIDQLVETSTQHFAEIPSGDFSHVTFDPGLKKELLALKEQLQQYGPAISVRNLSDIKRVWDDAVYTLSTAGKVGVGPESLTATAMKEAKYRGANAIRQALAKDVPDIAELNQAVSHAVRLEDLVAKLHQANPSMSPGMKNAATALGAGLGAIGMGGGYAGHILGAHIGGAAARALITAMESPLWKVAGPKVRAEIADAIASGKAKDVLRLVAPMIQSQNVTRVREDQPSR